MFGKGSSSSPSGSTGTLGQPSTLSLPTPSPKLLLRLILGFAVCLGVWFSLRNYYHIALGYGADQIISVFAGIGEEQILIHEDGRFFLNTGLEMENETLNSEMPLAEVSWNLILFGAIVLAAPLRCLRRSWVWILCSLLILFASHVVFVSAAAIHHVAELYALSEAASGGKVQGFLSDGSREVLDMIVRAYYLTVGNFLPVVLAVPVYLMKKLPGTSRDASTDSADEGAETPTT